MKNLDRRKKEMINEVVCAVGGSLIFALGVNLIIVPINLYNGGFMGIAQILRTVIISGLHIPVPATMDLAGIIYFIINIPLFYMGYQAMGKAFTIKTLLTVALQSILLVIVPIPSAPIISDYLTACVIGGFVAGIGTGLVLRGRTSGGGGDILGIYFSKKYPNTSVGTITNIVNLIVYGICLFMFNIETVVYSLIYATIITMMIDKVYIQNINTSVMIFTKKTGIAKAIMEQTGRGVTDWTGEGAYTQENSYILFVMISKYEVEQIKRIVHGIDSNAFMIFTDGCSVDGNFEKRL